ncbi:MAG: EamA family transporter [Candidatus Moranbacteria bacterium]|nr:EamA family transporter [Candidatus Moranbacteria bacterium]
MNWLIIAILAYLLIALEIILDKFLLSSKRISHPVVYAFYSGILSAFTLVIFPFGGHSVGIINFILYAVSGMVFLYGILCLFSAINKSEASQVAPVVGAVIPLVTYFLSLFFLKERLGLLEIMGVIFLITGGLAISLNLSVLKEKRRFFSGFYPSILAGVLIGISMTAMKRFYEVEGEFINAFVWTRLGVTIGALSLLFFPAWRKIIRGTFLSFRQERNRSSQTGLLFIFNKVLGGFGSILTNYAISLGAVTVVNAMVSLEFVFILVIGMLLSFQFPKIFRERYSFPILMQKIIAIAIIALGVVLVSIK